MEDIIRDIAFQEQNESGKNIKKGKTGHSLFILNTSHKPRRSLILSLGHLFGAESGIIGEWYESILVQIGTLYGNFYWLG